MKAVFTAVLVVVAAALVMSEPAHAKKKMMAGKAMKAGKMKRSMMTPSGGSYGVVDGVMVHKGM